MTVLLGIAEIADEIDLGRARQTLEQLRDSTEPEDQLAAKRAETRLRVAEG